MRRFATATGIGLVLAVSGIGIHTAVAKANDNSVVVAERADNFRLVDAEGRAHELYRLKDASAIVFATHALGASDMQKFAPEIEALKAAYADKGVEFMMINATGKDNRDAVAAEAKKLGLSMPVLMDDSQLVSGHLGVTSTSQVFVVNPKNWEVVYHGALNRALAEGKKPKGASYAADAIDAVIAGQPVSVETVAAKGTSIAFPDRTAAAKVAHADISYAEEVAPILEAKCVTCHQEGSIAPFAMDRYEVVKGFAPMIRESIRTDRMPPYFADPHIGEFKNNQELSPDQRKTLIHWLEAGAPRGEGPDLLKLEARVAPEWPEELGEPDVVVELPPFTVPASGVLDYQYPVVDNPFDGDTWLKAISVLPGDRGVVHHVTCGHVRDPDADTLIPGGSVGSYTPGAEAQVIAEDAGAPGPAGGKLRYSMHYTTNGKESTDVTKIGYYLHDEKPKYVKRATVISDFAMKIPSGEARHTEYAYQTFPADAYIYTLYPHAHYRGVHVELKAFYPDGKEEMLLSLPKYDFNWQRDYDPVEPLFIPAGTKLQAKWVYDNSEHNHANPDHKIDVTWGDMSWEEMMYFRVNYRFADETTDNLRNDLQEKLMSTRLIGGMDDNLDGLIQKAELSGSMSHHQARFEEIDLDGNGGLDNEELRKGKVTRFRSLDEQAGTD